MAFAPWPGPTSPILHASVPVHGENLTTVAEFTVSQGRARLVHADLWALVPSPIHARIDAEQALKDTENSGANGRPSCSTTANTATPVERSLITLKALTFRPTGGIVAAATTSLPECIGGVRNWDYRYCWLRDTTFTLLALTNGGYYDEATAWQDWLLRAVAGSPDQIQIMYGLKGERQLVEWEADWLPGYESSRPGAGRQRRAHPGAARYLRRNAGLLFPRAEEHGGHGERRFPRPGAAARASGDHLAAIPTKASGRLAAARSSSPTRR